MTDLIDPQLETPTAMHARDTPIAAPERPSRPSRFKKWRARLIVVAMIAAAVYGGVRIARAQADRAATLELAPVTLTAQGVPVESLTTGSVTKVLVHAQQHVVAGQQLATVQTTTTSAEGEIVHDNVALTAPITGIVTDAPLPVGTVLQAGQPFVTLYNPSRLTFVANLPLSQLASVSAGMVATLNSDGLSRPIHAVVERVVPRVGNADPTVPADQVLLILVPSHPSDVASLIPGLRFTGSVDTNSTSSHPVGGSLYVDR